MKIKTGKAKSHKLYTLGARVSLQTTEVGHFYYFDLWFGPFTWWVLFDFRKTSA